MINRECDTPVLIYLNGSSRTEQQVKRKLAFEEETKIKHLTDFPARRDFDTWTDVITRRQDEREELLGIPEHIEVEIRSRRPILLSLFADSHGGAEGFDARRFAKDVSLVKEVEGYSITVGDLTDSFFFQPGVDEQILQGQEQILYMQSALDELAEGNRLIAGIGGDHDLWSKDKMGAHTLYHQFHERYNAHYMEGVSHITIGLNNGEETIDYRLTGSHRHRGFSVYNDSHAALRQEADEGRGADISFTAHQHIKGHNRQVVMEHGGKERVIDMLALGSYRTSDRYSRKKGFPRAHEESMGAFGLVLHPEEKIVEVKWTIEEAIKNLK